jgi:hypothetical protein
MLDVSSLRLIVLLAALAASAALVLALKYDQRIIEQSRQECRQMA